MTEFNLADHGVTKGQKSKSIGGLSRQASAAKTAKGNGRHRAGKGRGKTLILIRTRSFETTLILSWLIALTPTGPLASEHKPKLTSPTVSNRSASMTGSFGLFPAETFRITTGNCNNCPTSKQALWYFRDDIIAVPKSGFAAADLAANSPGYENVLRRLQELGPPAHLPYPNLIWLGSPEIILGANLLDDGKTLQTNDGTRIPFSLVPKISTNRSYYNSSSIEFFRHRTLRARGATQSQNGAPGFVARTIWPEDFRIRPNDLAREPLRSGESVSHLITKDRGGAESFFDARSLWERAGQEQRAWARLPVLGLLLSGGQGDDDESQAGHLAVITGKVGADGEFADWMVNNFYNLDEVSEKGIIASMLPMDNYLMDLNSGQSYYRPTYLLVAVLKDARAASRFQAAIQPLYNHFYRHDFLYHHSKANCTGISIDTLRAIGWQIPRKGATSYLKAAGAFLYLSVTDRSLASGKKTFDYLSEEQTRLFPRVAFEAAADDLLGIVHGTSERNWTDYEQTLREDALAVLFIRIPQIPSSRALGTFPVASFDEYQSRTPADRSKWKIVPVDPRPFPEELREPLSTTSYGVNWPAVAIVTLAIVTIAGWLILRGRSAH